MQSCEVLAAAVIIVLVLCIIYQYMRPSHVITILKNKPEVLLEAELPENSVEVAGDAPSEVAVAADSVEVAEKEHLEGMKVSSSNHQLSDSPTMKPTIVTGNKVGAALIPTVDTLAGADVKPVDRVGTAAGGKEPSDTVVIPANGTLGLVKLPAEAQHECVPCRGRQPIYVVPDESFPWEDYGQPLWEMIHSDYSGGVY